MKIFSDKIKCREWLTGIKFLQGELITPHFVWFAGILTVFYVSRYLDLCWEFDNCKFYDFSKILQIIFSGAVLREWLGALCVWIAVYSLLQLILPEKIRNGILTLLLLWEILLGITNFDSMVFLSAEGDVCHYPGNGFQGSAGIFSFNVL